MRKNTLTREHWNNITNVIKDEQVPKSEVVAWLREHGAELSLESTRTVLQTYFDVQVNDTVVVSQNSAPCPVIAVLVKIKGETCKTFIINNLIVAGESSCVEMILQNPYNNSTTGVFNGCAKEGIFYFFLEDQYYTIRRT